MAFSQSTTTRPKSGVPKARPKTSMNTHSDDEETPSQRKRQGMIPAGRSPSPSAQASVAIHHNRRVRAQQSISDFRTPRRSPRSRDVSISTAFSKLDIGDRTKFGSSKETQSVLPRKRSRQYPSHQPPISTSVQAPRARTPDNAVVLYQTAGEVPPKTPSFIPVPSKSDALAVTPSLQRNPKPLSPTKGPFLVKDSNVPGFTAWDVEGRLEDVESMFSVFKNTISNTGVERFEEKEILYKTKSIESRPSNVEDVLTLV